MVAFMLHLNCEKGHLQSDSLEKHELHFFGFTILKRKKQFFFIANRDIDFNRLNEA